MKNVKSEWSPGTNNWVIGTEFLSGDAAPPADGVNFIGTDFVSSNGTLTAGSADWQVDLITGDYTSPVSEVSDYPDMGPPPTWTADPLQQETEYRARVKYRSTTGEESPWSNDATFKTAGAPILKADPGDLQRITGGTTTFTKLTCPVKIVNFGSSNNAVKAVGIDGKLYGSAGTAGVLNLKSAAPTNIGAIAVGYNNYDTNLNYMGYLFEDQTVEYHVTPLSISPNPSGETFTKIGTFGCVTSVVYAISTSDEVWVAGEAGKIVGGTSILANQWIKLNVTLPGGRKIKETCGAGGGNYDAPNILLLADDGTLWSVRDNAGMVPGIPQGTPTSPAQVSAGTTFTHINTASENYSTGGSVSAIDTDGNLWYAATVAGSFNGVAYSWQKVPGQEGLWEEPICGSYTAPNSRPLMGLRKDGYYWSNTVGTLNFFKVNGQTSPTSSSGTGRNAQNYSGAILWAITPD